MAANLFFSQPMLQKPPGGIYNAKIGPSDSAPTGRMKTNQQSRKAEGESFLKTLKKVSRNTKPAEMRPNADKAKKPSKTKASVPEDHTTETSTPAAAQNGGELEPALLKENTAAEESDQSVSFGNFMALIRILEKMGHHLSDGGSDGQNLVDVESSDGIDVATLKIMMARLQQSELISSSELKAAFERLQQSIVSALKGINQAAFEGNTFPGQALNHVSNSAKILQWLQELTASPHHPTNDVKMSAGEGDSAAKPFEPTVTDVKSFVESAANSIEASGNPEGSSGFRSADNDDSASQIENRGAMQPVKKVSENLPFQNQVLENAKEAAAVEKAEADTSSPKEDGAVVRESKTVSRFETIPAKQPVDHHAPSETKMGPGNLSSGLNQTTAGEETLSKGLDEDRALKEGKLKLSSGMTEDTGGKVIKAEAGANDSGLLNAQDHPIGKAAETSSLPKTVESEHSALKNQTLDQIVQKAAIHLKNGQHEARIDLKPELLGHIRMQVISENHQVTVRIQAEHGFVKDMIENRVHQLKANLHQQGLDIDKLEVSVSRDSDDSGAPKDRPGGMRTRHGSAENRNERHFGQDPPKDNRQPRRNIKSSTGVDYFA